VTPAPQKLREDCIHINVCHIVGEYGSKGCVKSCPEYVVHSASSDVLDELMKWICDCDGGDVAFNPKLGLFSSPQPFNTIGLIHKIAELRQQTKEREQGE
jgi:hypothetical protein